MFFNILNQSIFNRMISGKSTFDLEKVLESGKVLLLSMPLGLIGDTTLKYVGRFILSQVVSLGLRRAKLPKEERRDLFVIVDEAPVFLTPSMAIGYEQLRKYGIYFCVASQSVEQLEYLENTVVANSNVKIIGFTDSKDTKSKLSNTSDMSRQELDSLAKHEFFCKIRGKSGYKFKPSSMLIGGAHTLKKQDQEHLDKVMLDRYYRQIEYVKHEPKLPTGQEPTAPFELFIPDDTAS